MMSPEQNTIVKGAMDEHAKRISLMFGHWIVENEWRLYGDLWEQSWAPGDKYTDDEIFDLFKQYLKRGSKLG